jgi:Monooxygenase subunit B protein
MVDGDAGSFTDPLNTLTNKTVDLEHYGLKAVVRRHLLWVIIAVGWLLNRS